MIEDILFLPDIYLPGVIVSGLIIGWLFGQVLSRQILVSAAVLFLIYGAGQLIFRFIEGDQPLRFVGHIIYYITFLTMLGVGSRLAEWWKTRKA